MTSEPSTICLVTCRQSGHFPSFLLITAIDRSAECGKCIFLKVTVLADFVGLLRVTSACLTPVWTLQSTTLPTAFLYDFIQTLKANLGNVMMLKFDTA